MKNCRVLGYFFWSRSLCRVTIYHGMKDVRIIIYRAEMAKGRDEKEEG